VRGQVYYLSVSAVDKMVSHTICNFGSLECEFVVIWALMVLFDANMKVRKSIEKGNSGMFFIGCDWDKSLWYLDFDLLETK
jgi:hypothetical protein